MLGWVMVVCAFCGCIARGNLQHEGHRTNARAFAPRLQLRGAGLSGAPQAGGGTALFDSSTTPQTPARVNTGPEGGVRTDALASEQADPALPFANPAHSTAPVPGQPVEEIGAPEQYEQVSEEVAEQTNKEAFKIHASDSEGAQHNACWEGASSGKGDVAEDDGGWRVAGVGHATEKHGMPEEGLLNETAVSVVDGDVGANGEPRREAAGEGAGLKAVGTQTSDEHFPGPASQSADAYLDTAVLDSAGKQYSHTVSAERGLAQGAQGKACGAYVTPNYMHGPQGGGSGDARCGDTRDRERCGDTRDRERLERASRGDSCTVLVSGLPEDCRPREVPAPLCSPCHTLQRCPGSVREPRQEDKKERVLLLTDGSRSPGVLLDEVYGGFSV